MAAFEWDQGFVTGLPTVDEQHHGLVDLFNELNGSLFGGVDTPDEELEAIFRRLTDYAQYHFTDEEQLMAGAGLDARHIKAHREEHAQFVAQVSSMWSSRHILKLPSETIMGFLTSWLSLHILGVDQSMARQILAMQGGLTAPQAYDQEERQHDKSVRGLLRMVGSLYGVLARQNADLVAANQKLEARVRERTLALAQANEHLQDANVQLQAFSRTDGLLRINNRAYFDERLLEEIERARRQKQPLSVLMMDVDFFKRFNDTYGHQAGDACLQAVAKAVGSVIKRRTDFLARYGGEELVALLPNTDAEAALPIARAVVAAVQAMGLPHAHSDAAPVVTLSVGVASAVPAMPADPQAGAHLLAAADAALYQAKHDGRNRAVAE
jgi:hemerythrin